MQELLPSTLPALANLKALDLGGYFLRELPASMARSLANLTSLTWRSSQITEIPPSLSLITTLRELKLFDNYRLRLGSASVTPLLALQRLTLLELNKSSVYHTEARPRDFTDSLPKTCTVQWRWLRYGSGE